MTRESLVPRYLRGVLTVEAELARGSIDPDGWMHTDSTSPVLVALNYAEGTAILIIEDADHLAKLRIPAGAFLRLIDGAERKLDSSSRGEPPIGE